MLAKLKTEFYSLLKGLGYNITDNAEYRENFPWLMVRTNGYQSINSFNLNVSGITLVLDIFSTYPGEKEIIEIVENIGSHLDELRKANPEILFCYQISQIQRCSLISFFQLPNSLKKKKKLILQKNASINIFNILN